MEELIKDKEELLKWVEKNPSVLKFASDELRKDREFMLQIIRNKRDNTRCIEYMDETFKADGSFILQALNISRDLGVLHYATDDLKNNKEFMTQMLEVNPVAADYMSDTLKQDKEYILQNVKRYPVIVQFISKDLRKDKEIFLAAIESNPYALNHADYTLKNDRRIVLAAMSKKTDALQYASDEIRGDTEFLLKAARTIRTMEAIRDIETFVKLEDENEVDQFYEKTEKLRLEIYAEIIARDEANKQMKADDNLGREKNTESVAKEEPRQESVATEVPRQENEIIDGTKKNGIKQKIAKFLENKKLLRKISFINNFVLKQQGKLLPGGGSGTEEKTRRNQFVDGLSNNGEYRKLSEQKLEVTDKSKDLKEQETEVNL